MPRKQSGSEMGNQDTDDGGTSVGNAKSAGKCDGSADYFCGSLKVKHGTATGWKYRFCAVNKDVALLSVYKSEADRLRGKRELCLRLVGSTVGAVSGTRTQLMVTELKGKGKGVRLKAEDEQMRDQWLKQIQAVLLMHSAIEHQRTSISAEQKVQESADIDQIYHRCRTEAEKQLQCLMSYRKDLIHRMRGQQSSADQQKNLKKFFEVSRVYIDAVIDAVNKLDETKQHLASQHLNDTDDKLDLPKLVRMSTWSDTQTEWFDAKSDAQSQTQTEQSANNTSEGEPSTQLPDDQSLNIQETAYDEDDSDDEGEDGTENKKIMGSILSNMKGGDLSKTGMPVFVLAKLSFLEKFANYFANADYFPGYSHVIIPDDPKQRFLDVVKWYISSFRPGWSEKSKKPFNPILGEVFECYYYSSDLTAQPPAPAGQYLGADLTGANVGQSSRCSSRLDASNEPSPVPWAGEEDVVVLAEQVSHHPPITAFYAESLKKKVQLTGHVLAKSNMHGLSAVMKMEGEALLKYLDYNETYQITYPTVYCRSVLSKPWAELGEKGTVVCLENGFKAHIQFHTKGSFGSASSLHSVSGKLLDGDDNQFGYLKGHWNKEVKVFLSSEGSIDKKKKITEDMMEPFVQIEGMRMLKKRVRPLSEQEPHESRRVWQDLIENLRERCWPEAEKAKHRVEQEQREKKKERDKRNETWTPRHFEVYKKGKDWDFWEYKNALDKRA